MLIFVPSVRMRKYSYVSNIEYDIMKKCLMLIAMASVVLSCTTRTIDEEKMMNKIRGGWVGKVIGVQYGQPYEFWYLGKTNDGELNWDPACVEGALGQDDIYTQMSFMQTFDTYGLDATPKQLGDAFANAGFSLCHANLQGRKNIFDGIDPPLSGSAKYNAHADDIDFQIDADFIGFMNPGMPHAAYEYCDRIGHIMNDGDGFYGGVFVASMHTLAFFDDNILRIVEKALRCIPAESAYARCIREVVDAYKENPDDWKAAWQRLHDKWEDHICTPYHPFNIDAKMNGAYIVIGLLYGKDDFAKTMEISIRCGQDADCNPSNAAALWGIIHGYDAIPKEFKQGIPAMEDRKFAFTDYSLNDACDKVMEFMKENIIRNGGKIRGNKLIIKTQTPGFEGECVQAFPGMKYSTSIHCNDPAWRYSGAWREFVEVDDDAVFKETREADAFAEVDFEGRMVTLIGAWDKDCGMADVYLDGERIRRIDNYINYRCGFSAINRQTLFVASGLEGGKHTLRIVNTTDKNPKSVGNSLMFTRIDVYDKAE